MTRPDPAHLLSAALRAQAGGSPGPAAPPASPIPPAPPRKRLPVIGVLLFALVLGLLAGGIVGALTLLHPVW
ncbi:hypothetical protein [Saccharopolyspora sp. ASAGF58]|uniref:hypothetical protein n=1 Tax=Saccharopolyspora sp. ASAGF58 TaxID=2719023 RepID=UPI0014402018|nr:hypothetical protein [Saccharopolyspora sp. ASAGF58]QIZ35119.1 hypothetical protein FDZ84_10760 [Saccharopolyspora sp. ASAGF58]